MPAKEKPRLGKSSQSEAKSGKEADARGHQPLSDAMRAGVRKRLAGVCLLCSHNKGWALKHAFVLQALGDGSERISNSDTLTLSPEAEVHFSTGSEWL